MTPSARIPTRGAMHSLTGLCVQVMIAGLLIWASRRPAGDAAVYGLWSVLAGIPIWLHLMVTFLIARHEAIGRAKGHHQTAASSPPDSESPGHRPFAAKRLYQRVLLPSMEVTVAVFLIRSLFIVADRSASAVPPTTSPLLLMTFYAVTTMVLIVFTVYISALMRPRSWQTLRSGRNYAVYMVVLFTGLLVGACGAHFGIDRLSAVVAWGVVAVNAVLAAEILLSMVIRFFVPRRPGVLPRPAFDLYLLEAMAQPRRIGQTFSSMLEGIFGFDITQTSFGRVARALILPSIAVAALLLAALSSVVLVKPYEQAIVLTLGRLDMQPLQPGLHFKLPWPLAVARRFNTGEIHNLHVGSHQPTTAGGTVFRKGVPILWTNMHGLDIDELLICSSPREMIERLPNRKPDASQSVKVPSVSLAAADVRIQFVIDDVIAYVRSSASPEAFLRNIAKAQASRLIYRYDIDALFCEARLALVEEIQRAVQTACDRRGLGVGIVHAAITAVHPPVEVAGDFEETVAALQERETRIQYARQSSIRSKVETTGTVASFDRLSALADSFDTETRNDGIRKDVLLQDCGGDVSRILAEAGAYRFSRENEEQGDIERFDEQLRAFTASPRNYRCDRYLSILEKGLAGKRKVLLLGNHHKTVLRMGMGKDPGYEEMAGETGF